MLSKQEDIVLVMVGKDDKNRLLKNQTLLHRKKGDANSRWHLPVNNRSFYFKRKAVKYEATSSQCAFPDFLAKATHQPVSGSWRSPLIPAPGMTHSCHVRNRGFHTNLPLSKKVDPIKGSSVNHAYNTQPLSLANSKVDDRSCQRHSLPVVHHLSSLK